MKNRLNILHGGTIASMVDLGGSLAVASRGLFATGVSTDLNGTSHLFTQGLSVWEGEG
jgi:acyl-coenzyme A thioesterase 13